MLLRLHSDPIKIDSAAVLSSSTRRFILHLGRLKLDAYKAMDVVGLRQHRNNDSEFKVFYRECSFLTCYMSGRRLIRWAVLLHTSFKIDQWRQLLTSSQESILACLQYIWHVTQPRGRPMARNQISSSNALGVVYVLTGALFAIDIAHIFVSNCIFFFFSTSG